jgi:hypothetical protein
LPWTIIAQLTEGKPMICGLIGTELDGYRLQPGGSGESKNIIKINGLKIEYHQEDHQRREIALSSAPTQPSRLHFCTWNVKIPQPKTKKPSTP